MWREGVLCPTRRKNRTRNFLATVEDKPLYLSLTSESHVAVEPMSPSHRDKKKWTEALFGQTLLVLLS